ncbi:MAG: Hpt domain-containing protein [Propionibacteriales bacterium]|nr:Hpt domain-containing protein [Propionibacteriales bacterium]
MAAPPAGALDRQVLEAMREALDDVSGEFVASLVTVFETQAVELMDEMGEAAQLADAQRVGFAAHSLKGSSANMGGNRLADLCTELEHWGGNPDDLPHAVATVRVELAALLAQLRDFVPR